MRNTTGKYTIHFFRADLAAKYGVPAALLLNHIHYWISLYERNNDSQKYYDGRYWTYGSRAYFTTIMPYFSGTTISRHLKKLEDYGLVITSSKYNKMPFDKTKWYTISDLGWTLFETQDSIATNCNVVDQNSQTTTHNAQPSNQNEQPSIQDGQSPIQNGQTIPNISTNTCTLQSTVLSSEQHDKLLAIFRSTINPTPSIQDVKELISLADIYGYYIMVNAIQKSGTYNGKSIKYISRVADSLSHSQNNLANNFNKLLNMIDEEDN